MIIGITGPKQSGKTTLARYIAEHSDLYWEIKGFATPLKQIVSILTGVNVYDMDSEKIKSSQLSNITGEDWDNYTVRKFLQFVGTDLFRKQVHPDIWIRAALRDYDKNTNWIMADVRFQNEVEAIKKLGGKVIKIQPRQKVKPEHTSEELNINYKNIDTVVYNFGSLEMLYNNAEQVLKYIINM